VPKDACYTKVKAQYAVFPSARASQAIAKCRKGSGNVRKTKAGSDLKRWQADGLQRKYQRILLKLNINYPLLN
jgi:hypothetical protein